jgi:hypothetical protein
VCWQMEAGRNVGRGLDSRTAGGWPVACRAGVGHVNASSAWLAGTRRGRRCGVMVRRTAALLVATVLTETAGCTIGSGQASKIGPAEALNRPSNTIRLPFMMAT